MSGSPIRVLLADDDALVRSALSMMLAGTDDIRVVAEGKSNAEIAATLHMSVATVKAHVSRLLTKLELNNRVQIALLAHDAGLA